jgi:tetratricopeptide (TPR) repeat protein
LDITAAEAGRAFSRPGDIIRTGEAVWVPVETTLLGEGFMAAWAEGARAWREHSSTGAAGFFSTAEAWRIYEPVAFGVSDFQVDIPHRDDVSYAFETELDRFVSREIAEQEERMLARLRSRPSDARTRNRLGVLYARYGKYDDAEAQFERATAGRTYVPALVNMGNIAFQREDFRAARDAYERALRSDPDNTTAILGLARLDYNNEDYKAAEEAHARLSSLKPELADQFSYLGSSEEDVARATDRTQRRAAMVWEEE